MAPNIASKRTRLSDPSVIICEYHHNVLSEIHDAIRQRTLPFSRLKMVHFDSHPDLMFPLEEPANVCFEKDKLYETIGIADWILPLVYEGHLSAMTWVKPSWATQISPGTHRFTVGKALDGPSLRLSSSEDYFLEELLYAPKEKLENQKPFILHVRDFPGQEIFQGRHKETGDKPLPEKQKASGEDSGSAAPREVGQPCKDQNCKGQVEEMQCSPLDGFLQQDDYFVLDIDLDFFSVQNPFRVMFDDSILARLNEMFRFEPPEDKSEQAIVRCYALRQSQIETLTTSYEHYVEAHASKELGSKEKKCNLDCMPKVSRPQLAMSYLDFMYSYCRQIESAEGMETVDLEMLHFAGLCGDLPHHVSTQEEVRLLLCGVKELLTQLPRPCLITMARSAEDLYSPPEQVDWIQAEVIAVLQEVYGDIQIKRKYERKPEESEESNGSADCNS